MKNNGQALLEAVEQIYECAEPDVSLETGISGSSLLLGASRAVLLELPLSNGEARSLSAVGLDERSIEKILESCHDDEKFLSHYRSWDQDNVYDSKRLQTSKSATWEAMRGDQVKTDPLAKAVAGVILRNLECCILLVVYRDSAESNFDDSDRKNMGQLIPHWRRLVRVRQKFAPIRDQLYAMQRVLDHAPFSIALINAKGAVLYENYQAETCLRHQDGIAVRNGVLRLSSSESDKRFMQMLEAAEEMRNSSDGINPVMMSVERHSGAKPYQLMILPLRDSDIEERHTEANYAIFIYDPTINLPVDIESLRNLEGLTIAEARLCESLYTTKSLSKTAEQLGVSLSTAKTHLLNTFRKLDINSQSELMTYLSHMPKVSMEQKH